MISKRTVKTKCIYCNGTGKKARGLCSQCDGFGYYFIIKTVGVKTMKKKKSIRKEDEGTEGQDRKTYSDTQDRKSYTGRMM